MKYLLAGDIVVAATIVLIVTIIATCTMVTYPQPCVEIQTIEEVE